MLEIDNYLAAARDLAARMHMIFAKVLLHFWPLISVAVALAGEGLVLIFMSNGSNIVAGASSILVALGLTWKGLGGTLGQLTGKLEQPLLGRRPRLRDRRCGHAFTTNQGQAFVDAKVEMVPCRGGTWYQPVAVVDGLSAGEGEIMLVRCDIGCVNVHTPEVDQELPLATCGISRRCLSSPSQVPVDRSNL